MPRVGRTVLTSALPLLAWICFGPAAALASGHTTVILVRHAEKQGGENPSLTEDGLLRAEALVQVLGESGVTAIYSTSFCRTVLTSQPLAAALGLPVVVHEMGSDEPGFESCDPAVEVETVRRSAAVPGNPYENLAGEIRSSHEGKTVVVVGHSNTVPLLAEALGAPSLCRRLSAGQPSGCHLPEDEYHHLFVLTVGSTGPAGIIQASYGQPTGRSH